MDKEAALAQLDEYGYAHLPGDENVYLDGKSQRVWNLVNKGRIYEEMIQLPAKQSLHPVGLCSPKKLAWE